jgi:hypothetical protein
VPVRRNRHQRRRPRETAGRGHPRVPACAVRTPRHRLPARGSLPHHRREP